MQLRNSFCDRLTRRDIGKYYLVSNLDLLTFFIK